MPNGTADERSEQDGLSRRHLFKQLGVAGVAAAAWKVPLSANAAVAADAPAPAAAATPEALETLTAAEADILEAIVARLIPTDGNGAGATEARAAHYIDRALAGPLAGSRATYAAGLAALDAHTQSAKGASFAALSAKDQDDILSDLEKNAVSGFMPNSATFFELARMHTIQGTFCDPYYGGNANFFGWDLIGYPGIRMAVDEDEQRLKKPAVVRQSAYDNAMFTMRGGTHGHQP